MNKKIEIEGAYGRVVNFAMQQNYVPIVKKLIVKNLSDEDISNLEIIITVEPEFAFEWKTNISIISALQAIELDVVDINLSPNFLYGLTEKMAGTIFVKAKLGEEVLVNIVQGIDVLAYDEWSGSLIMPEIISAFITPNHPKITEIIIKASKILKQWCENPSFTGYQSNNPNTVKMQMAAIYTVLQNENISYCVPPASYEIIGQRVRHCDSVFEQRMGTCLDLSLLYASCIEAVGLHPLIIFLKGHAFVGCWLEDECFAECVQDDISMITKRTAQGINEICLVECTGFVAGKFLMFDDAVKAGNNNLSDISKFEFIVDVKRTRGSGIRPIPQRKTSDDGRYNFEKLELLHSEYSDKVKIGNSPEELELFGKIENVEHIEVTRQQIWERKLLDLSLRNTLVSFRVTRTTIQLMVNQLSELEDALASGQEFQVMAKPKEWDNTLRDSKIYSTENQTTLLESIAKTEFENKRIRTFIEENEVEYAITNLYRQARISLEENGTNTLYLALGFLKWYESNVSEKERYAPIVLIPIDIVRKSAQKGYVIRIRDEEPQMNITLLEMLRQDFGLTIGGLDPLPTDDSGINLKTVFNTIRQAIMGKSRWDVEELAFIGLFSFSQFIMWNDICNRSEDLKKNKIVASLLSGKMEWEPNEEFQAPDTLDDIFTPLDVAVPISADSTQLSAICEAGKGNSFVLHGPPGTGKSQTITNIIANALFQGKSVLFIAEKMAALSVVQKRLESIGLAPFCLELHSNKAKKKDVLEQLEEALEIGKIKSPQEYEEKANRIYDLRKKLNIVVKAIHKKQGFGFSLYEAITCFEQYKDYADCIKFTQDQIKALTPQKYMQWIDLLGQLKVVGKECGSAYNNPLYELANCTYSQDTKGEIEDRIKDYVAAINNLHIELSKLGNILDLKNIGTYTQTSAVIKLIKQLENIAYIPAKLFESQELSLLKDKVTQVCEAGQKRDELERQLTSVFSEEILKFDDVAALKQWQLAESSWLLAKSLGKNKVIKSLKELAKNVAQFNKDQAVFYINLVTEYKANGKIVCENNEMFNNLFGLIWNNGKADWKVVSETYNQAVELNVVLSQISNSSADKQAVRTKLANEVLCDLVGFKQQNEGVLAAIVGQMDRIVVIEHILFQLAGIDFSKFKDSEQWLATIGEKAKLWLENLDGLRNWCSYLKVKATVEEMGLSNIICAYENGLMTEEDILPVFYRGVSLACANYVVDGEPCLSDFNGAIFEDNIEKYKQTCMDFESLTKDELIARLAAKIPATSANFANSSEIGILQKAIRSGGRTLSIRKLFDSIPNLLRKLCPCMLMSPISVAQYIDPKYPQFDLVVFDEASQLPTCEAVGAIARGNNVIIVGDPKQLPPTNFFSIDRVDEDNYDKEDLESILDDCLALSMPQKHLLWHYRSKHESLIAFSNMQYYDNKLFTFPSPNDLVSSVKFIPIDGYYDRGKTKQNRAEAESVIAEILRRLSDPVLSKQSIGVVTFSSVQQNLIDDLLLEAFAKNPELEEISNQLYEPIFIKNLENVQGDERDTILFSVGYGPDSTGKTALNFGPINRDGGWRRLNVAVSRARREMMVFSTLKPEQIDLSKTRSEGVAGLKAFLEFADRGKSALPTKLLNITPDRDIVEKIIAEKIRKLGYEVNTNIGCSEYKIDIGIIHPNRKGEYILGIMFDGKKYHAANTARDRNILQISVLKSLGWNIHRLWILDWWENQDKELEKIRARVEEILENAEKGIDAQLIDVPSNQNYNYKRLETDSENLVLKENNKYKVCALEAVNGEAEGFYSLKNNRLLLSQIEQVLNIEAPISKNLLCKRILNAWGITRLGARLDARFEELFNILGVKKTISNNNVFYWNNEQLPEEYKLFRVPEDDVTRRSLEQISSEEIANAIKYILDNQLSLLKPDLIREVYKLFGFSRGNSSFEEITFEGLGEAIKRNYVAITQDSDRVIVKEC